MKNIFRPIYALLGPIIPVFILMIGGIGVIYCVGVDNDNTSLMLLSLLFLLTGISIYTYQQAKTSELFKQRFQKKSSSSSSSSKSKKNKRSGKRCPQCSRLIYHRRTECQHCGHKFASHKEEAAEGSRKDEAETG